MHRIRSLGTDMVCLKNRINRRVISKVTKSAKGEDCRLMFQEICNQNPETTVFAHYRHLRLGAGLGLKPTIFGAACCSSCHDECDGRTRKLDRDFVRARHAEASLIYLHDLLCKGSLKLS